MPHGYEPPLAQHGYPPLTQQWSDLLIYRTFTWNKAAHGRLLENKRD